MSDREFVAAATWPAQHRAALVVVVHIDAPDPRVARDEGIALGLDYAVTGLPRLLRICGDLGIEVTTAWTNQALATHPQMARAAHEHGHELSLSSASLPSGNAPVSLSDVLVKITGTAAAGHVESLTPGAPATGEPRSEAQPLDSAPPWIITGAGGDIPVIAAGRGSDETSVMIPVSPYWIDASWFHPRHPAPPSSLLEAWSAGIATVRAEGGLMTIVLHPHIAGRPGFADSILRFLDEAIASGDVWIARADHLALWWKASAEQQS